MVLSLFSTYTLKKEEMDNQKNANDNLLEIFSANRTAKFLDISKSYLYKLTHSGALAYYKPAGKKIYFLRRDLEKYLLQNRISSAKEISEIAVMVVSAKPKTNKAISTDGRGDGK